MPVGFIPIPLFWFHNMESTPLQAHAISAWCRAAALRAIYCLRLSHTSEKLVLNRGGKAITTIIIARSRIPSLLEPSH